MSLYYDRLGVPIDLAEWAALMEDLEYRRIAETYVGDVHISTVWIGIDHSWWTPPGGIHLPIIFETMVFPSYEMERYATEAAARDGHEQMVEMVVAMSPDATRVDW